MIADGFKSKIVEFGFTFSPTSLNKRIVLACDASTLVRTQSLFWQLSIKRGVPIFCSDKCRHHFWGFDKKSSLSSTDKNTF